MKHWLALMSVHLSDKIGSSNFISHGVQQLKNISSLFLFCASLLLAKVEQKCNVLLIKVQHSVGKKSHDPLFALFIYFKHLVPPTGLC